MYGFFKFKFKIHLKFFKYCMQYVRWQVTQWEEMHIHQNSEKEHKLRHPAGTCYCKRKQNLDTACYPEDFNIVTCLYCLMYWIQSCVPRLAVYKVWKICQPKSFYCAHRASGMSYGKGAGELVFEKHWRKWVRFYRITPHLADWNCYQMWPCSGLGIYDKLKGVCAERQVT